jgi:hypothetical protein
MHRTALPLPPNYIHVILAIPFLLSLPPISFIHSYSPARLPCPPYPHYVISLFTVMKFTLLFSPASQNFTLLRIKYFCIFIYVFSPQRHEYSRSVLKLQKQIITRGNGRTHSTMSDRKVMMTKGRKCDSIILEMTKRTVTRTLSSSHSNTDLYEELRHPVQYRNLRQLAAWSGKGRWTALCAVPRAAWRVKGGVFQALLFATLRLNWHVIGSIYQVSQRATLAQSLQQALDWQFHLFLERSGFCSGSLLGRSLAMLNVSRGEQSTYFDFLTQYIWARIDEVWLRATAFTAGVRFSARETSFFYSSFDTVSSSHPDSHKMWFGAISTEVKRQGRESDHSHPYRAEGKSARAIRSLTHSWKGKR